MSAHAIQARRDLADLFVLFLDLLEPLFLFLLDGRRSVKPTGTPAQDTGAGLPDVVSAPSVPQPLPPAVAVSDTSPDTLPVPVTVAPPEQVVPDDAAGPVGDSPEAAACGRSAPTGRFVKVAGRFRPAPDGFDGTAFVRVRSAGGRVTYRPVAA